MHTTILYTAAIITATIAIAVFVTVWRVVREERKLDRQMRERCGGYDTTQIMRKPSND